MKDRKLTFPMYLSWKEGCIEVLGDVTPYMEKITKPVSEGIISMATALTSDSPATSPVDKMNSFMSDVDEIFQELLKLLIPEKGYLYKDIVYVYKEKKPKKVTSPVPYFYINEENGETHSIQFKTPMGKEISLQNFSIDHMVDYSYDRLLEETAEDEILYDEDMLNDMNSARSKFVPIINKDDDYLKKLIKYAIIKKDVDINRYKSEMETPYALTNMKSALIATTKMSVTNFLMWAELLKVDFQILIEDNGFDKVNPLKESLLYRSRENSVYTFDNEKCMFIVENKSKIQEALKHEKEILIKVPEHLTERIEEEDNSDTED